MDDVSNFIMCTTSTKSRKWMSILQNKTITLNAAEFQFDRLQERISQEPVDLSPLSFKSSLKHDIYVIRRMVRLLFSNNLGAELNSKMHMLNF